MQQSSMIRFCDECGVANEPAATQCRTCHQPLAPLSAHSHFQTTPLEVELLPVDKGSTGATTTPVDAGISADLLPGTILLGRYQICREIGRGGFSIVYLAEDLTARRWLVAIKRISLRTLTPQQIIDATETCNREIRMLSALKSVHGVPQLYESFTDRENWYLAMQYIQGQTLETSLQKAPGGYLPEIRVAEIGEELASTLQKLHQRSLPIIFRDVKPSNIMITPDDKLYLIDFGIARFFTPGQKKDTTPLGSPGYAPPEQYGRTQTDGRADIYSLGATLQTLLTGRDPLELAQGEQWRNPHPSSPGLRKLLDEMLEPEASKRPATMKQVKRRLLWLGPFGGKGNRWRTFLSVSVGVLLGTLVGGTLIALLPQTFFVVTSFTGAGITGILISWSFFILDSMFPLGAQRDCLTEQ